MFCQIRCEPFCANGTETFLNVKMSDEQARQQSVLDSIAIMIGSSCAAPQIGISESSQNCGCTFKASFSENNVTSLFDWLKRMNEWIIVSFFIWLHRVIEKCALKSLPSDIHMLSYLTELLCFDSTIFVMFSFTQIGNCTQSGVNFTINYLPYDFINSFANTTHIFVFFEWLF